ncbi:MAG: RteC domain-containing protein [Lutibacter sp.]
MIYNSIISDLDKKLEALEMENNDSIFKSEAGITYTEISIKRLQKLIIDQGFKTLSAEIHFFKHIKPQVFSKLIYYVKLINIESKRPRSRSKSQIKYLNNHIDKLQIYFNDNLEFYHYYRRGATFLDEQYFVRGKADLRLHPDSFHFFTDEQFSTSQDNTVATIMAYDMLIVYLQQEIEKLENKFETVIPKSMYKQSKLFWTGSKTDLIELIYALHSSGVINSGTADIKELASVFEQLFNIELGNYYHTFIEIRSRKCNNTKFLDRLKESLIKRIEILDE